MQMGFNDGYDKTKFVDVELSIILYSSSFYAFNWSKMNWISVLMVLQHKS